MTRRPRLAALESRLTPGFTALESPGSVTFTGDAAGGSLAVTTSGNQIRYAVNGGSPVPLTQSTADTLRFLTVNGGSGSETIDLSNLGSQLTAMAAHRGGAVVHAGSGDDLVHGTQLHDTLAGGDGADTVHGHGGDDLLHTRDAAFDTLDGGTGHDSANFDSFDSPAAVEIWNPMPVAADNRAHKVKVLVVNYDPLVPSQQDKHLYELFPWWGKPQELAAGYKESLERASGGAVRFDIVEWRNVNDIPVFENGYHYTADEYYQNRVTNTGWQTGPGAQADVRKIFRDQGIPALVDAGAVDEVWFFGDHFFAIGGEAFMAGPGAFFINGPVYSDTPVSRPFACYGFSYERQVAEMLHNTGHRVENHGQRAWGSWNLADPTTNWDKFSANVTESNGLAGVGTVHFPPNGADHYDYGNTKLVQTWADDFLDYPEFTGAKHAANRDSWRRNSGTTDDQQAYLEWYFHRMPRGAGVNADGRVNNWYKYIYDYANYAPDTGAPLPLRAWSLADDVTNAGAADHTFRVAVSSPAHVNISAFDNADVRVTGPNGYDQLAKLVSVSDAEDGPYRVATYRVTAAGGSWDAADFGSYTLTLQAGQVGDRSGATLPQQGLGAFQVRSAAALPLANDADTSLLLRFDGSLTGVGGENPTATSGTAYDPGVLGQSFHPAATGWAKYATSGNISHAAGTVEFWLRPDWNATDPGNKTFFNAGTPFNNSVMFQFDDWADWLKMMVWGDNPDTPAVETNWEGNFHFQIPSWKAGEWHHVAVTWDVAARTMAMYADGNQVQFRNDMPVLTGFSTTHLAIGADVNGGGAGQAAYDEWRVSTRARSSGELAASYRAGIATAGVAVSDSAVTLPRFGRHRLFASATAAFGGNRDISTQAAWTTSDPAVATVTADGVVRAHAAGSATITATFGGLSATCVVTSVETNRPTAVLTPVADLTSDTASSLLLTVTYADDVAVQANTLENRDLWVHSANGYSRYATFIGVTPLGNGSPRTATYQVVTPGGTWDERDNGTYVVELVDDQVGDTGGTWAPAGVLGTFRVTIGVPTVSAVQVQDGSPQRSMLTQLRVTFSEPMTLTPTMFALTGPAGAVPISVSAVGGTLAQTTALVTFAPLADGDYTLTVPAAAAVDGIGQLLAGDFTFAFHRLFGDADGNRAVNFADFLAFRSSFGQVAAGNPFDGDGDGDVDFADFLQFRGRFGTTLP